MTKKSIIARVDIDYDRWAKGICKSRYIRGLDERELSKVRLSKAITRVPKLKKILEEAKIEP